VVLLAVGEDMLSDFGLFYQFLSNEAFFTRHQDDRHFVYRALLELNESRRSSAAGFLQSMVGFIPWCLAPSVGQEFR
jgi:putative aldouronate transport system permease protein